MSHRFIFLVLVYLDFSVSPGSAANQKRVPANPPANRSRDTLSHPRFSRIGFIFDKCINVFLSYYTLSLPFFCIDIKIQANKKAEMQKNIKCTLDFKIHAKKSKMHFQFRNSYKKKEMQKKRCKKGRGCIIIQLNNTCFL